MSPSLSCMSDVLGRPCGGVECKPQKGGMLTVGVNVPKALRFLVKRKTTDEETKETVRLHKKFAAAAAALQDGDAASSSSAPPNLHRRRHSFSARQGLSASSLKISHCGLTRQQRCQT